MKHFVFLYLLSAISLITRSQDVSQIISETNLDSLVKTVRILSGEDSAYISGVKVLIRSRSNSIAGGGNDKAANYIKERLLRYNLKVEDQVYSTTGRNIIATQTGINHPDSIYIVCAHYDAVANYCADDDASGVAAVIEAARILSARCFDYTIIYALFDNEEDGMLGSKYYAQTASTSGLKIAGVLDIEMMGYDSNNDKKFEIHTNNLSGSLALKNKLISTVGNYGLALNPTVVNPGSTESDHSSFWNKNIGAVVYAEAFFTGDPNPYYHTDRDRISAFNLPYFKELARLGIGTVAVMAQLNASCQPEIKTLSVSPASRDVGSSSGHTTFSISSNTVWTISSNASWLTVNPSTGSNNGTITANYTSNFSTTSRVGTITISGTGVSSQQVIVTQAGIPTLSATPSNQSTGSGTGSTTFNVSSNISWTASSNSSWLTVNPAGGNGNGTITATFTANLSTTSRIGTITISGAGVSSRSVTVTQSGKKLLAVTPFNQDVGSGSGSTTFTISSNTSWTITVDSAWLAVNRYSGTGNSTITATYSANTLASARIGTITVSGTETNSQPVTVTQSGISLLAITPFNQNVGSGSGDTTFSISSNTSWTISVDASWLTVTPASGSGNGIITVTYTPNTLTSARIGTITVSGSGASPHSVTVTQSGINVLAVTPFNRDVGSSAGSTTFSITSNSSWTIAVDSDWLTVNPVSGNGDGTITAIYTDNTLTSARIGTITISGAGDGSQPATVTQGGITLLAITPFNSDVGSGAGSTTFSISSNTSWTISADVGWLTLNPLSGTGNGIITATFSANSSSSARIGTITVSGAGVAPQPVTVRQSGVNLVAVTPINRDVGSAAGSTTFTVSSNTSWTIAVDAGWMTVNPSSGSGDGTITVSYTANLLDTVRIGTITISGTGVSPQPVTVTQNGINILTITPDNRDVGPGSGSTTFTISSNTSWTIAVDAAWLTVNPVSGSGNGTITATYTANTLDTERICTITVSGQDVNSQQVTVKQSKLNSMSVTPVNRDVGPAAGSTTFSISSNTDWTVAVDAGWLTVNPSGGTGIGVITANYTANTLSSSRTATITISGTGVSSQQVTVTQSGINVLVVTPDNQDVGSGAGSTTFTINSNTSWTISEDAAWLTVNLSGGSGNATITAVYTSNTLARARTGTITISGTGVNSQHVTVTQSGISVLAVTPINRDLGSGAGSTTFTISSNTSWTISSDVGWLTVNPSSGTGNRTITATYTANALASARIGTITVSGAGVNPQPVTVTQSGINILSITPFNRNLGSGSGITTFTINSNTSWTISSNASWLTVSPASGSGNGTITATCSANTLASARIGTITVSGTGVNPLFVTVSQSGISLLAVTPFNRNVGSGTGTTTFSITSNTSWTISSNSGWLTVNPASGTGNGTITATFAANTLASARIATITISGAGASSQPVTVTQSGIDLLAVTPINQAVGSGAGDIAFSISSNTSWTITVDATWLTVTPLSGSGNRTITVTFTANTLASARIGTITTVSGTGTSSQPVTVTQSGRDLIAVIPFNRDVGSGEGNTTFTIHSNTNWTITDDAAWLTVNPENGNGNKTITATYAANTLDTMRICTITISGSGSNSQQVNVSQSAINMLSVTPFFQDVGSGAGATTFTISSNTNWTIVADAGWLTVDPASGSGNGTITATYTTNATVSDRSGIITISGTGVDAQQVSVNQSGINLLLVTPFNREVGSRGGSTTFTINSNTNWTISSNATWLTVSPVSGIGYGTLTTTYESNASDTGRVGTITISGTGVNPQLVTVTQNKFNMGWELKQNYPNPFTHSTSIEFFVPERCQVQLTIFNINGVTLLTLLDEYLEPGWYTIDWIPSNTIKSGIYFYHLRSSEPQAIKEMFYIEGN